MEDDIIPLTPKGKAVARIRATGRSRRMSVHPGEVDNLPDDYAVHPKFRISGKAKVKLRIKGM